jgi:hypothetical protein
MGRHDQEMRRISIGVPEGEATNAFEQPKCERGALKRPSPYPVTVDESVSHLVRGWVAPELARRFLLTREERRASLNSCELRETDYLALLQERATRSARPKGQK